ncbi:hypothetical protein IFO69_01975 [Echinicola sp. CAU 1574]|uniref:Uncharacterized protein n=1 Tax=Echinicola arenosa TaxID=2774144 RepID=A0ABR9AHT8_9BACT|nr:hypothetical protein [Echinicola arenosa]MBD8487505.1 hypothetical protein [Echinicola arenosa]
MIRTLSTLTLIFILAAVSKAQSIIGIENASQEYANANLTEDYETLIKYTYPFVLKKSGGKEGLRKALSDMYDLQKIRGMKMESFEMGAPLKLTHASGEVHAIIPVTSKMKVPGGELITHITLIAVSKESSDQWYFIEASNLDPKLIHNYLPTWDYTLGLNFESSKQFISNKTN